MSLFSKIEIRELLEESQIGLWKVEFGDNIEPRFYADDEMDKLLGLEGEVTPEERYLFHRGHIHPDDLEIFDDYAKGLVTGLAEVTYRYIHPTLGEMYVRCNGKRDNSVTDIISIKGTHQNISNTIRIEKDKVAERRLAEKNLKLEEQLDIIQTFGKIFNSSYYIDMRDGSFVELSTSSERVQRIIGSNGDAQDKFEAMCKYIVDPDMADDMREFTDLSTINERLKGKKYLSRQFFDVGDSWAEGYFIAAKRNDRDECEHLIWATRSIKEIKEKELAIQAELQEAIKKAQVASEAKTNFLFNMSHDIRTPMNAIMGFTELLSKDLGDKEKCINYIDKIRNANEFLLSLINNVLEMARIESGKIELFENAWSTEQFNDSLYSLFEEPMRKKNISFIRKIDVEHEYVYCDPVKLREIFLNILSNACKYTPTGGTITMELNELPSEREGYVRYRTTITDTGIGMSKEYLPHLFDSFTRERNATDSRVEGTGLGMPIVKKLVELMGGNIEVESELGKGTKFIVTVTHRIASKDMLVGEKKTHINNEGFVGKRVILAEDNNLNAEIAMAILSDVGFIVERAVDGAVCVEKLANAADNYYDLILMDIQMPNMNGYQATQTIRKMDSPKSNIPIIAMTANAFQEDKRASINAGMNAHVSKPIVVDALLEQIISLLNK